MSLLGWPATLPLELGGDDSSVEKLFKFLRSAIGQGGSPEEETGIEGLRASAFAIGLAAAAAFDERAALQAFPNLAIDAIPAYEEHVGIIPGAEATEQERREEAARLWVRVQSAEVPSLTESLRAIDSRYSVLDTTWERGKAVDLGRAFAPYVPGDDVFGLGATGAQTWSDFPNYSDRDLVIALLDLGAGVAPGQRELLALRAGRELFEDVLPAWAEGHVITELGFVTASSLTGYAGVTGS